MKIGAVEIPALARLAPMAGITNAPFRLIARECGSGLTTSEEMDAAALLTGHPFADAIAAYYPAERPLAMQLLGKDPDLLARAAERCQVLGRRHRGSQHGLPDAQDHRQGQGRGPHARRRGQRAHPARAAQGGERAAHGQDPRWLGRRAPQRGRGGPDGGGRGCGRHHRAPAHPVAALHRQGPVGHHPAKSSSRSRSRSPATATCIRWPRPAAWSPRRAAPPS